MAAGLAVRFAVDDPFPFVARPRSQASPLRRAPGGSRPISASASIVFPEPDSPTMPSVSPSPSVNETSFTGRTQPARVGSSTVKPRASRRVAMATSYVQPEGMRLDFAARISCERGQWRASGMTKRSAVCVSEKRQTLLSVRPADFPAAMTSASRMCFWPLRSSVSQGRASNPPLQGITSRISNRWRSLRGRREACVTATGGAACAAPWLQSGECVRA